MNEVAIIWTHPKSDILCGQEFADGFNTVKRNIIYEDD